MIRACPPRRAARQPTAATAGLLSLGSRVGDGRAGKPGRQREDRPSDRRQPSSVPGPCRRACAASTPLRTRSDDRARARRRGARRGAGAQRARPAAELALGGTPHDLLARADRPRARRRSPVLRHVRDRLGRLPQAPVPAVLDRGRRCGRGSRGAHRDRRGRHHRRRRRVLGHDRGPHARVAAVRAAHDAELRP